MHLGDAGTPLPRNQKNCCRKLVLLSGAKLFGKKTKIPEIFSKECEKVSFI